MAAREIARKSFICRRNLEFLDATPMFLKFVITKRHVGSLMKFHLMVKKLYM